MINQGRCVSSNITSAMEETWKEGGLVIRKWKNKYHRVIAWRQGTKRLLLRLLLTHYWDFICSLVQWNKMVKEEKRHCIICKRTCMGRTQPMEFILEAHMITGS